MAYTAEQIAALPISDPKLKAKFAASHGVPMSNPLIDAVAPPPAPVPAAPAAASAQVNMPPPAAPYEPKYVASVGNPTPVPINKPPTLADDPMFGGPQPAPAAPPPAPSPLLPNVPVVGPPAPPAGLVAPPPKPGGPMQPGASTGPALPLQAPAQTVAAEGLYHGKDPLSFGLTPGQQKLQVIQGQRLYGEGQFAEQDAAVDANTAADYSGVAQQVSADADARAAAAQKKAADRQAFLAKYNADTEKQINDYANAKIDPGRLWAGSQGTGNAIAATIGSFVAGIAGFMDPSKDYVGQFANRIEGKIQQDIDLQKAEIAKKGAGIEARRGLYGSYLQQFGQEDAAEAMAYETYLRKTKAQIDSYASKATSEKAKVQLGALSAALEDRQKMWAANRQAAGESMIDSYYAAQAKAQAQAAAARMQPFKDEYEINKKVAAKAVETGGWAKWVPQGTVLPNGEVVNNPYGMHMVKDANGNYVDTGTISAKAAAGEGGGGGPKPINTITGFNEKGQPLYGAAMKPVSPKAGDDYLERTEKLAQAREALMGMKALRKKNNGGAMYETSEEQALAAKYKRKVFTGIKTLGENSDKDAAEIWKVVPDPLALDMKAGATMQTPYNDALIDAHLASIDEEIKRLNNTHFQAKPTTPTLPLTAPDAKGK